MTHKSPMRGRIPASELPSFKRWALPQVASRHVVSSPFQQKVAEKSQAVQEEELDLSQLTVDALQKLRDDAQREGYQQGLDEGRSVGEAEGRERGQEAGYQAAYQQAQGEIDDLKARLGSMIRQLVEPLDEQHQALEQTLLTLVGDIARAVVGQELATRPELLHGAVRQALDRLPQHGELCFTVHPDDETQLQALRDQEGAGWEVRTDATLTRGSLKARGMHSYLEYRVEGRFSEVMEQLLRDAAEQPEPRDERTDL